MEESRLGKYELRATLGRGAMGTVYEGWDPVISRKVAIKTVRLPDAHDEEAQEELARFKREAQAAGRLSHPNIVGVFDYGETAEIAYIVMEYIDGQSLKAVLDRKERFPVEEILRVMEQLLSGLQFSHERGVVHRDIKPANVMLTSAGQAKIADFGIARIDSSAMTQAGTVLGTPAYMSPEQLMGQVVDARTDIYSAGVLLYQLLTGERPFDGSMSAIMHKALNTEPPLPSQLSVTCPPAFDAVVRRAMAKRPEHRYPSAAAFAAALHDAACGRSEPARESEATTVVFPPRPIPAASASRRSPMPVVVISVLVLLVLSGGGAWWLLRRPATIESAPLRRQVADLVRGRACTLLDSDVRDDGSVSLAGLAGSTVVAALRQAIGGMVPADRLGWRVSGVDPVFCPVLDALRPIAAAGGVRLGLTMADGRTRLHDGDPVRVRLTMPDFASRLHVDYVAHDGSVQHLYPQLADAKSGLAADPPRGFAPRESVDLGNPAWTIGEPYGTDMIIAVASAEPLFGKPRPGNAETVAGYVGELRAAIEAARQRGVFVSGAALALETLPK
ncbi:MAG: protein kinase [Rhodospirillales bacterium]|nr:protein kinase [Rhodospirillales bacterium]